MSDYMQDAAYCAHRIERSLGDLPDISVALHRDFLQQTASSLRALLAHIERGRVPEGWKLVPVEPTPEMIDAYIQNNPRFHSAKIDWAAMLAAAPAAPSAQCLTCNGHGMIGGLLPNGGGYESHPCPDCAAPAAPDHSALTADRLWPVDGLYPDMLPPATQKERWMFDQGRLAERRIAQEAATVPAEVPDHSGDAAELRPEFSDSARAALLWVLWHHQGGSSPVGQPIRFALGMGRHEHLSDWQVAEAKRWGELRGFGPGDCREYPTVPAEVPMPEPDSECTHQDDHLYPVWNREQMQQYGDAREAAGYARGRAEKGGA